MGRRQPGCAANCRMRHLAACGNLPTSCDRNMAFRMRSVPGAAVLPAPPHGKAPASGTAFPNEAGHHENDKKSKFGGHPRHLLTWSAVVAGNEVDDDLRRAAKLQKNGSCSDAVAIWKRRAERGNADAAYNLAVIHQHGDGVAQDCAEALRWYRHAANLGDRISEYQIGLMYLNGEGVSADPDEAHRWLTGHRRHHAHHAHDEKMQTWRKQAAALIEAGDRREALAKSRADDAQVLAELKRRAGGNSQ